MDEDWTPFRKWWMDILKSAIIFTVAAILTYKYIDQIQYSRDAGRAAKVAELVSMRSALDELRNATFYYHESAYDAYIELEAISKSEEQHRQKGLAMREYEGNAYTKLLLAAERVQDNFPGKNEINRLLENLLKEGQQGHDLYDKVFRAKQGEYLVFITDPAEERAAFRSRLNRFYEIRSDLLEEGKKLSTHAARNAGNP